MPKIRIAAMTSVVMIGRLMKSSEIFTGRLRPRASPHRWSWPPRTAARWGKRALHDDLAIGRDPELAIHDDRSPWLRPPFTSVRF